MVWLDAMHQYRRLTTHGAYLLVRESSVTPRWSPDHSSVSYDHMNTPDDRINMDDWYARSNKINQDSMPNIEVIPLNTTASTKMTHSEPNSEVLLKADNSYSDYPVMKQRNMTLLKNRHLIDSMLEERGSSDTRQDLTWGTPKAPRADYLSRHLLEMRGKCHFNTTNSFEFFSCVSAMSCRHLVWLLLLLMLLGIARLRSCSVTPGGGIMRVCLRTCAAVCAAGLVLCACCEVLLHAALVASLPAVTLHPADNMEIVLYMKTIQQQADHATAVLMYPYRGRPLDVDIIAHKYHRFLDRLIQANHNISRRHLSPDETYYIQTPFTEAFLKLERLHFLIFMIAWLLALATVVTLAAAKLYLIATVVGAVVCSVAAVMLTSKALAFADSCERPMEFTNQVTTQLNLPAEEQHIRTEYNRVCREWCNKFESSLERYEKQYLIVSQELWQFSHCNHFQYLADMAQRVTRVIDAELPKLRKTMPPHCDFQFKTKPTGRVPRHSIYRETEDWQTMTMNQQQIKMNRVSRGKSMIEPSNTGTFSSKDGSTLGPIYLPDADSVMRKLCHRDRKLQLLVVQTLVMMAVGILLNVCVLCGIVTMKSLNANSVPGHKLQHSNRLHDRKKSTKIRTQISRSRKSYSLAPRSTCVLGFSTHERTFEPTCLVQQPRPNHNRRCLTFTRDKRQRSRCSTGTSQNFWPLLRLDTANCMTGSSKRYSRNKARLQLNVHRKPFHFRRHWKQSRNGTEKATVTKNPCSICTSTPKLRYAKPKMRKQACSPKVSTNHLETLFSTRAKVSDSSVTVSDSDIPFVDSTYSTVVNACPVSVSSRAITRQHLNQNNRHSCPHKHVCRNEIVKHPSNCRCERNSCQSSYCKYAKKKKKQHIKASSWKIVRSLKSMKKFLLHCSCRKKKCGSSDTNKYTPSFQLCRKCSKAAQKVKRDFSQMVYNDEHSSLTSLQVGKKHIACQTNQISCFREMPVTKTMDKSLSYCDCLYKDRCPMSNDIEEGSTSSLENGPVNGWRRPIPDRKSPPGGGRSPTILKRNSVYEWKSSHSGERSPAILKRTSAYGARSPVTTGERSPTILKKTSAYGEAKPSPPILKKTPAHAQRYPTSGNRSPICYSKIHSINEGRHSPCWGTVPKAHNARCRSCYEKQAKSSDEEGPVSGDKYPKTKHRRYFNKSKKKKSRTYKKIKRKLNEPTKQDPEGLEISYLCRKCKQPFTKKTYRETSHMETMNHPTLNSNLCNNTSAHRCIHSHRHPQQSDIPYIYSGTSVFSDRDYQQPEYKIPATLSYNNSYTAETLRYQQMMPSYQNEDPRYRSTPTLLQSLIGKQRHSSHSHHSPAEEDDHPKQKPVLKYDKPTRSY